MSSALPSDPISTTGGPSARPSISWCSDTALCSPIIM